MEKLKSNNSSIRLLYINYPCPGDSNDAPLLSFGYLGTISKIMGCQVHIIDANFHLKPYTNQDIIETVNRIKPHLVGMTLFTYSSRYGYSLLKQLKEECKDALYVAGGPHTTILPQESLKFGFDVACRGEGEKTMGSLIRYLRGEIDLNEIKGIDYRNSEGNITSQPHIEAEENLDALPIVDYDLFDPLYFSQKNIERSEFGIFTSRGCPSKCTFCNSYGVFGTRYRYRSAENVLYELELLNKKYGITVINFLDDYFTLNRNRMADICQGIIKRNIKIRWGAYSKAGVIPKDLFGLLKESGCINIAYGIENVYPKTLKLINKRTSLKAINETYKNTHDAGIPFKTNIMAGFPWETKKSLKTNIDFILKHKRNNSLARFNLPLLYPIPSTKLYEDYVEQFPAIKETWLNPQTMQALGTGEEYLKVNLFNLKKSVIREIKFLAFIMYRIMPLKSVNKLKRWLIYPFKRIIYSYYFLKLYYILGGRKKEFVGKI